QVQSDRSNLAHGWLPFAADSITAVWHSDAARGPSTPSFNHLVGDGNQFVWNLEAERFGRFEVDHHLVFGGSLHGQISRLVAIQNAINVDCGAPELVEKIWPVRTQPTGGNEEPRRIDRRQPVLGR